MIALKNATLIDGTGRPPKHRAVVGIEGQRISLVATEEEVGSRLSEFDTILDLEGKTIIPGLINCHEHLMLKRQYGAYQQRVAQTTQMLLIRCVRSALLCLREGVTTIRDVGAIAHVNLTAKEAIEKGMIIGPRVFTCGSSIAMTGGHGYQNSIEVDGPDEVRKAARQQLKAGADLIKVKASGGKVSLGEIATRAELTVEEMRAAVEEAHRPGKPTTAHAHGDIPVRNAIEAGIDCIEHGMYINTETAERMIRKGVWLIATLSQSTETADHGLEWGKPEWLVKEGRASWPNRWEGFLTIAETGVKLAAGTDGFGLMKQEIALLAEAGLGPMGAIVAATARGAEVIGRLDDLGTVEPGKFADLAVLDGDPLADISAVGRVTLTIKDGVIYDPQHLALATGTLQPPVPSELGD